LTKVAQIDITRTELVWPGKYDQNGRRVMPPRVHLPFQTIETINESRASREAKKKPEQTSLFDVWTGDEGTTFEEGWRNKLIWGENLLVMSSLLEKFSGKIDLIYIDPPFATGADFNVTTTIGDEELDVTKEQSAIEERAYRDTWGRGLASYLEVLAPRLAVARDLLSERGSLYVHCDWRANSVIRLLLDEVFGIGSFRNEIAWCYTSPGRNTERFKPCHDTLLYYSKTDHPTWTNPQQPLAEATLKVKSLQFKGQEKAWTRTRETKDMVDWWDITFHTGSGERLGYPTQKPEALLERVLTASSLPGDLVADFFVGSGTTAAVAEKLGRRWIACDLGRFAVHTTRKRLMGMDGCKPLEILNLGKYERQFWQAASFSGRDAERVLFEYLAFILKLYGAAPVAGMQHIHGKRSGAVVHVGAVDAPVTISEVIEALDECVATGQHELHVLGWEWEMGLNDLVDQLAQERRVRLKLLAIPREVMEAQAVEKGDIRFFELAHLDCRRQVGPGFSLTVELTDFAMSDADAIDPDVRAKITKWSDFVDYWAIDFDFQNDTFMNGWVAYRTRKERRLALQSDSHRYPEAGTYHVGVKVVDIFGNDTTRVFAVEVK
jgi:adenine-specific DNA-methyltransferase